MTARRRRADREFMPRAEQMAPGDDHEQRVRALEAVPVPVVLFIKVFSDTQVVTTGDGKFIFEISEDMAGMELVRVESYVTTVSSSGKPTVQIRNVTQAADMLSTKCEIDASEKNSEGAATQAVIDTANDDVNWVAGTGGDHISIDVDVAGTGAMGLGVMLTFV